MMMMWAVQKRCKEKRKSQYPTLNLHVLGLYMYVYVVAVAVEFYICAYSSSSSLFMIWLLIDYERRRRETAYRVFVVFSCCCNYGCLRVYICILLPRVTYYYVCCLFSLTCRFHFDLFSFLFSCMHHIIIDGWIMPYITTWAVENSLIMTRLN